MPINEERKLIYIHIPKTGGTFLRRLLRTDLLVDENPSVIPSPQHLTCSILQNLLGDKFYTYYRFTFVRNPWSRMVSEFVWRQSLPSATASTSFLGMLEHARQLNSMNQFYKEPFDDHFIPQVRFTTAVEDIFRFEDFKTGVATITQRIGLELGEISDKPKKDHDDYWSYYDKKTRSIVNQIYADDIQTFGYSFE